MINNLNDEIASIEENLSILPTKTKKNKVEYNTYIDKHIEEFNIRLKEVIDEINIRYDTYDMLYTTCEDIEPIDELDANKIKLLSSVADSSEKMNLNYYFYELKHFYKNDLNRINGIILEIINKFRSVGVELSVDDLNYTEAVNEYITTLLTNTSDIKSTFDRLYWENPNLITQIELNFRRLYFKYKSKIDKFYSKNYSADLNKLIDEYNKKRIDVELKKHNNVKYLYDKLISKEVSYSDLKEDTMKPILSTILLDIDNPNNYLNLLNLRDTLIEYSNYLKLEYIIKDMKTLYEKKADYKGVYKSKYKEIVKKEKELFKLTKQINTKCKFKQKNIGTKKLKRNNIINELSALYNELDSLKIQDIIFNYVNDDTSYFDIFKIVGANFNYFVKLLKTVNDDLTVEIIDSNINTLYNFICCGDLNVISNVSITEEKNISQIISDKYRLINISVLEEKITSDSIDEYIGLINNIIYYYDAKKLGIDLDNIDFILSVDKLREK